MSRIQQIALICATLVSSGMAQSAGGFCTADTDCTGTNTNGVCQSGECGCATDLQCSSSANSFFADYCVANKCVRCRTTDQCGLSSTCTDNACVVDSGCTCDTTCENDYKAKFWGFSIGGAVLGIIFIIVASVPCCCGKDFDSANCPKIAGGLAIVFGLLSIFFPAFGVGAATEGAVEDTCKSCTNGCTTKQKDDMKTILNAFGIFVAYIAGGGWLCIILGITAAAIGCCACCPCCGPLKTKRDAAAAGAPAAQGTVVGQPA
jgi:hypothetical protein